MGLCFANTHSYKQDYIVKAVIEQNYWKTVRNSHLSLCFQDLLHVALYVDFSVHRDLLWKDYSGYLLLSNHCQRRRTREREHREALEAIRLQCHWSESNVGYESFAGYRNMEISIKRIVTYRDHSTRLCKVKNTNRSVWVTTIDSTINNCASLWHYK